MSDQVRVIVQVYATPAIAAASFGPVEAAPMLGIFSEVPEAELDTTYSPVPIPPRPASESGALGMATAFSEAEPATHVVRAAVPRG